MKIKYLSQFFLFRTITSRIFAILLLGIISASVLILWLAFTERQTSISNERITYRAERAKHTIQLIYAINALPPENRRGITAMMHRLGLKMIPPVSALPEYAPQSPYAQILMKRLSPIYTVFATPPSIENCVVRDDRKEYHSAQDDLCEALIIILDDKSVLRLSIFPTRNNLPPIQESTIYFFLLFITVIASLAYIVSRMTTRPLKQLAQAAANLGHDINHPPLAEQGTTEIQQATRAFNAMQKRIRDHIQQRTYMLAAITHDVQTPLTRLRLRLEKVSDDELRQKLIDDLSNMQSMIKEGLELARSFDSNEALHPLDIGSMLDSICEDANEAGQKVSLTNQCHLTIMARPQSLHRCLNNLIDNAVKYGGEAQVSITHSSNHQQPHVLISIKDKGPGIPIDQHEKVFEPFFRLENSRSRETGGTGLGLTIALNIVKQHGGELQLINMKEGGLEVRLSLPTKA